MSKWYKSLDDNSGSSLRVKINVDLSFSEIRRLYSIKFKKAYMHIDRERIKKSSRKEFMKWTLKILGISQGAFNSDSLIKGSKI